MYLLMAAGGSTAAQKYQIVDRVLTHAGPEDAMVQAVIGFAGESFTATLTAIPGTIPRETPDRFRDHAPTCNVSTVSTYTYAVSLMSFTS
jgi:hypothetical protein